MDDLELVTVLKTSDSFALTLAKSSLDDADIPYLVTGDHPSYTPGFPGALGVGSLPIGRSTAIIQVSHEFEAQARELLAPLQPKPNNP